MISSSLDIAASTNAGKPIVIAQPDHPASKIFRELAESLAGEPDAPSAAGDRQGLGRDRRRPQRT